MEARWACAAWPGPGPDFAAMGLGQEHCPEETDLGRPRCSESIAPSQLCRFRVSLDASDSARVNSAGSHSAAM